MSTTEINLSVARILLSVLVLVAIVCFTSGCQTMREHPYLTGFVATSLVISAGTHRSKDSDRHIPTPSVDCSAGACK